MLIDQIIEFELREAGPPGRTCTSIIDQFQDKKPPRKIFEWTFIYR